ncbi:MAG: cytochrome c biogenesis protein CcdA [Bacteroidota bacterium]
MSIYKSLLFLILFLSSFILKAQILQPASWSYDVSTDKAKTGEEIELIFNVTIDGDWYLYSSDFDRDCGPMVTTFEFEADPSYELIGDLVPVNPKEKYDDIFECDYTYFREKAQFRQKIRILKSDLSVNGSYEYQVCTDVDGRCIPFDDEFSFTAFTITGDDVEASSLKKKELIEEVEGKGKDGVEIEGDLLADQQKVLFSEESQGPILSDDYKLKGKQNVGLGWFFVLSFLAGLAALLTPCVFPMIPMTVTYFTGKGKGLPQAVFYGVSIIVIYSIIGFAVAPLMGPEMANHLSTEWLPNLIFFAVFVIFALSFFGLFEITLPHSFVNKMDRQADRGGYLGVFFMAFTLVLVSFSCTGPLVGSILVESAGGQVLKPIIGMAGFSAAFAIPFTLFAVFPGWLNNLPKSGGWLNSVKVVLGFLELAFAFKFLSIADQAFHWGILDREINIAIWIVIFSLLGFYLLGKLRLAGDDKKEHTSVPRLIMAMATFTFVVYLIPGMWGAPLKALAGYLPPMSTHDFDLVGLNRGSSGNNDNYAICEEPKYGDFLHLPHGLKGYFDYDQALECARTQDKPVFIDFTGHGCTNCREMEARVWSDPKILEILKNDYVVLALYVDDKTTLPEEEWYTSDYDGKVKKTIGKQNADLQIRRLNNNAQPFYVLLGEDEQVLVEPTAYNLEVQDFVSFLEKGKAEYRKRYL